MTATTETALQQHSAETNTQSGNSDAFSEQSPLLAQLLREADTLTNDVIAWRRHLHMHPELSFHEHNTAQYVFDTLSGFPGLALSRPTATSVVARLQGARPGVTIGVRADMDALRSPKRRTYRSSHARKA